MAAPHPVFKVDRNWPKEMPHGYVLGQVSGLTVDNHGNIWALSRPRALLAVPNNPAEPESGVPAPAVVEWAPDGRFLQAWGGPYAMSDAERATFDWPVIEHGIAVDDKGNVWLCGNGKDAKAGKDDNQCLKFSHDGKFLMQIGRSGQSKGSLDTENVNHAAQIVYWAKTNEVVVADGYVNRRVVVFDADTGKFKRMWGAYGNPPDDSIPRSRTYDPPPRQFYMVHGLVVAKDDLVYVADRMGNRVQAFTLDGKFIKEAFVAKDSPMTGSGTAFSLALSGDPNQKYLYVADGHNQKLRVLDRRTLEEISGAAFGHVGPYPGQFSGLHVITSDARGNIYTGDGKDGRVQKFVYSGLAQ